jgi:hypothetical protein
MKKKVGNQDVAQFIQQIVDKLRSDMDYDFRVAESQMNFSEKDLVNTFTKEQKVLYEEFCQKRQVFFDFASQIYQRKI